MAGVFQNVVQTATSPIGGFLQGAVRGIAPGYVQEYQRNVEREDLNAKLTAWKIKMQAVGGIDTPAGRAMAKDFLQNEPAIQQLLQKGTSDWQNQKLAAGQGPISEGRAAGLGIQRPDVASNIFQTDTAARQGEWQGTIRSMISGDTTPQPTPRVFSGIREEDLQRGLSAGPGGAYESRIGLEGQPILPGRPARPPMQLSGINLGATGASAQFRAPEEGPWWTQDLTPEQKQSYIDKTVGAPDKLPPDYKVNLLATIKAIEEGKNPYEVYRRMANLYPERSAELQRILLSEQKATDTEALIKALLK